MVLHLWHASLKTLKALKSYHSACGLFCKAEEVLNQNPLTFQLLMLEIGVAERTARALGPHGEYMKGRARGACLLLVLLSEPTLLAAAEDVQKDWCRPNQTYFDSYERAPSSLTFAVRELGGAIHCNRDDIASASTVIIALFTIVLVCYTISLAKSTKFSALIAEKSLIELERPWVILDGATITRRERDDERCIPNNYSAALKFKNIGRSPAIIESCPFAITVKKQMLVNPDHNYERRLSCQKHVASGDTFDTSPVRPHVDHGKGMVLYGRLSYREMNGKLHETGFAIEISPTTADYSPYDQEGYSYYT